MLPPQVLLDLRAKNLDSGTCKRGGKGARMQQVGLLRGPGGALPVAR